MLNSENSSAHSSTFDISDPNHLLRVRGACVLLVEDNPDNRNLIARYLRYSGAYVDFAENGIEGVKKALVNNYDIILMDIQMPRLDGLEATKKLREFGYDGSIVAITGYSKKAEREDCLEAGFDEYLTKPVQRTRLLFTIANQPRVRRELNFEARSFIH